jgi:hypothetical protein
MQLPTQLSYLEGDQLIEKTKVFEKVAKNQAQKCQYIYIKDQFESPKQLQQTKHRRYSSQHQLFGVKQDKMVQIVTKY